MNDSDFALLVDDTLDRIEDALDKADLDIDMDAGDGKFVITFDDGLKFILSRQGPVQQIWLAEPRGGWHFSYENAKFICDKRGVELFAILESMITEKLGEEVKLTS